MVYRRLPTFNDSLLKCDSDALKQRYSELEASSRIAISRLVFNLLTIFSFFFQRVQQADAAKDAAIRDKDAAIRDKDAAQMDIWIIFKPRPIKNAIGLPN